MSFVCLYRSHVDSRFRQLGDVERRFAADSLLHSVDLATAAVEAVHNHLEMLG